MEFTDALCEGISQDMNRLSGQEFKKKYGKSKFDFRQVISAQPIARRHFGYAPTGNLHGKWNASTSTGANPAMRDKVSGVNRFLASKQPISKSFKKGGVGGSKFGRGHIADELDWQSRFAIMLDEYGVVNLNEINESQRKEFLNIVDTLSEVLDEDGNSYGPFWEEIQQHLTTCVNCQDRPGGARGYMQPVMVLRPKLDQADIAGHICSKCGGPLHPKEMDHKELTAQ